MGPLAVVSIFFSTPLALASGIVGLVIDRRKWFAIAGLVISGAMAALIGGSFIVAICR